jgi:Flp pilus assembly protein TadD
MQLGESLAIGWASSKHVKSASDAWRRAYELDATDCHAGALAARSTGRTEAERWILELARSHPQCAEVIYLSAMVSRSGAEKRTELLQKSIVIRASAEALVALGQELVMARQWQNAERAFASALEAPPLFPEDWRPDGWVAVHAHMGLAWSYYSRKQMQAARREYEAAMAWLADPGPWHDLSEAEEGWREKLAARWPGITGIIAE